MWSAYLLPHPTINLIELCPTSKHPVSFGLAAGHFGFLAPLTVIKRRQAFVFVPLSVEQGKYPV